MNESISSFLEELSPFWHFLVPVIVAAFLGCLFGVILSCLFCRPKGSASSPKAETSPSEPDLAIVRELESTKAALSRAEKDLTDLREAATKAASAPSVPAAAASAMSPVAAAAQLPTPALVAFPATHPQPVPPSSPTHAKDVQPELAHVGPLGMVYTAKPQEADDLTLITGISPQIALNLRDLGIYRFDQISRWTSPIIDSVRKTFPTASRIEEEKWTAQARRLEQLKAEGKPLTALPREALGTLA